MSLRAFTRDALRRAIVLIFRYMFRFLTLRFFFVCRLLMPPWRQLTCFRFCYFEIMLVAFYTRYAHAYACRELRV